MIAFGHGDPSSLLIEQYRRQYSGQSGWEYRDGEAIGKPGPTDLHGILQYVLCDLLWEAGYISAAEVDLRIVPNWEPRPDVVGTLDESKAKYPTEPVEIVAEILSDDQMTVLLKKCRDYSAMGIPQIFAWTLASMPLGVGAPDLGNSKSRSISSSVTVQPYLGLISAAV